MPEDRAPDYHQKVELYLDRWGNVVSSRTDNANTGTRSAAAIPGRDGTAAANQLFETAEGPPSTMDPDSVSGGGFGPAGDVFVATSPQGNAPPCAGHQQHERLRDGRYAGGNHMLDLDLRIDYAGSGVISGDLFGTRFGGRDYLTSFRTAPGETVHPTGRLIWHATFETKNQAVTLGRMFLRKTGPETVTLGLYVDGVVPGLPKRRSFEMAAEWQGSAVRELAIELEQETGTNPPPVYRTQDRDVTLDSVMAEAGFDLTESGEPSRIPREAAGWGITQLHALMVEMAQSDTSREAWKQQLLWLGRPKRKGLLGVMFDTSALLPRQGTAVFEREIHRVISHEPERKVIQTTAHEIGHGLNLAHRFEREVGHADSTSIMNYDWRYKGGGKGREFWDKFAFSFDPDELEFLRHAPRHSVIPGGAAFHSIPYWRNGDGGYSPYVPEQQITGIDLTIAPPLGGRAIPFGQPLFLGVTLTNQSQDTLTFDHRVLDPKGGTVQIVVKRRELGLSSTSGAAHFHPIVERCFEAVPSSTVTLRPGDAHMRNVQVFYGSGGFAFAEPGRYEIQLFLSFTVNTQLGQRELIIPSNTLVIHVLHPRTREEELEVVDKIHTPDVGTFIALGGSTILSDAKDKLKEVMARREHGKKGLSDPLSGIIERCLGIDAGRRYRRYANGRFRASDGNKAEMRAHLQQIGGGAAQGFDSCTWSETQQLMSAED